MSQDNSEKPNYIIVECYSSIELIQEVNEFYKKGYTAIGGLSVIKPKGFVNERFLQPMILSDS